MHLLTIVDADDVVELARLKLGLAIEVGHLAIAVIRALGREAEGEDVLVVAEDPPRFGVPIVLNDPGEPAPFLGLVDRHPSRNGEVLGREKTLHGPVIRSEYTLHLAAMKVGRLAPRIGYDPGCFTECSIRAEASLEL